MPGPYIGADQKCHPAGSILSTNYVAMLHNDGKTLKKENFFDQHGQTKLDFTY